MWNDTGGCMLSFTSAVKDEINKKDSGLKKKCCIKAKQTAINAMEGSITFEDSYLEEITKKSCCKRAFLRGAFLASGYISDPEKTYHMEMVAKSENIAFILRDILNYYNLNAKTVKRKGSYIVYIKDGDHIADFLNIIGAHTALLKMENVRVWKDMRNNVNRAVNCETANIGKTVNASLRQIENIEYIKNYIGFENLPLDLKEIAEARLKYKDASLIELGEMLTPPLSKSGVNYRLKQLNKIVERDTSLNGSSKNK